MRNTADIMFLGHSNALRYNTCPVDNLNNICIVVSSCSDNSGRSAMNNETEPAIERQVLSLQDSTVEVQAADVHKLLMTETSKDQCQFDVY